MKSDTKPRVLKKAEINAVYGGNSEVLDAVGKGMAKGFGGNVTLGDTTYTPDGKGFSLTIGPATIK